MLDHRGLARNESSRVPELDFDELVTTYANITHNNRLQDALTVPDRPGLRDIFLEELKKDIPDKRIVALITDIIIFFTSATAAVTMSPVINSMKELDSSWKTALTAIPAFSSAILMIPAGIFTDRTGGKNEILLLRIIAIVALLGLIAQSALVDISAIKDADLQYAIIAVELFFAGMSIPSFLVINNIVHWFPINQLGHVLSLFGGLGNLGAGIFLMTLQFALSEIGLTSALILATSILTLGTAVMGFLYKIPPYHQLLAKGLSPEQSRYVASLLGQEKFPLATNTNYLKLLFKTANDLRAFTLCVAISCGSIHFTSTVGLYISLVELLNVSQSSAVMTTAILSMSSTVVRTCTGKLIDKFDNSSGAKTYFLGSGFIAAGALMSAIPRPLPSEIYMIVAQSLIFAGVGFASAGQTCLLPRWSAPNNHHSPAYNTGTMTGISSTSAQIWSLILPLITAAMVSKNGKEGYLDSYYLIFALTLLSSSLIFLTQKHLEKPLTETLRDWAGKFQSPRRRGGSDEVELGTASLLGLQETLSLSRV